MWSSSVELWKSGHSVTLVGESIWCSLLADMLQPDYKLRLQWPGPDAVTLGRCKQAESGNLALWFTAQLHVATQLDRHCGTGGRCTFSWLSCLYCGNFHIVDCTCLCGVVLAAVEAPARSTDSPVYSLLWQTTVPLAELYLLANVNILRYVC